MKLIAAILLVIPFISTAQTDLSKVWVADNGNGTYKNPVINADYSDPDAIRLGDDYYMISSSFTQIPGLPILHSKDLVNWKLIGHALHQQPPYDVYDKVQHGAGVWAPSIRYHNNEFYIYYPDPDFGIYLIKSKQITGPWSEPLLVEAGKGLIDPCPLWDDHDRKLGVVGGAQPELDPHVHDRHDGAAQHGDLAATGISVRRKDAELKRVSRHWSSRKSNEASP